MARGGPGGHGTRPGSPTGFLEPSAWGKCPECFPWFPGPGGSPPSTSPPPSHAPRMHEARGGPRGWKTRPRSPAAILGPKWAGEILGALPSDPLSPQGPSRCGNPTPLPATPQVCQSCLASTSPPPSLPPAISYPVIWGFLPSPWSSSSPTSIQQVP